MIWHYKCDIRIEKRGHELVVMKAGVDVRSFHEISDDYAYTNAQACARKLEFEAIANASPAAAPESRGE